MSSLTLLQTRQDDAGAPPQARVRFVMPRRERGTLTQEAGYAA